MSSTFGKNIKVSIFGQSHSDAIGVVVDGLPAGHSLDLDALGAFMRRRAPGSTALGTQRNERDAVEILSGVVDGRLCGAPFAALIKNGDVRKGDYANLADTPRPGHADYTAQIKYAGAQDKTGGGHFSGRLTAPLCVAGGVCLQLLEKEGILVGAHVERVGDVCDTRFNPVRLNPEDLVAAQKNAVAALDPDAAARIARLIEEVRAAGDSVGGAVECAAIGLPAGVGDPMFEGLENRVASIAFGIPAVKGVEFGSGFSCASMRGSAHNDPFCIEDGRVKTRTNNHGGILGGISTGMPVIFRVAFKPTPSIARPQQTVNLSRMGEAELIVHGRHDPCVVLRAVPVVEAAAAVAIYDAFLDYKMYR